jgi:5-methylcytosine-specific restriction endonuclease McrA
MALPRTPEAMQAAFVATNGAKMPVVEQINAASARVKKRNAAVKRESERQAIREAFLAGQKAALIHFGVRECSRCTRSFDTEQQAWAGLQLHHDFKRSQAVGYRGGRKFGVDAPDNLELVCKPCHRQLESNPEWSQVS